MKLTRYEKETIINFNEAEATANIYTHNGGLIRKLDALADQRPGGGKARPQLPGRRAGIYRPETLGKGERSRILTEEQKADIAARFKKA